MKKCFGNLDNSMRWEAKNPDLVPDCFMGGATEEKNPSGAKAPFAWDGLIYGPKLVPSTEGLTP
jgi:hypothetical protein